MCGINGIISQKQDSNLVESIKNMNNALARRGPDAEGMHCYKNSVLGHRRLSIIDLAEHAAQPLFDLTGRYALVFNGEIYNFKKLKAQLTEFEFRTDSDSEVIIAAYQKWGEQCVNMFEGMFAFAISDKTSDTIFIARDRPGIKPLYYYLSEGIFVFSSEIKALLASGLVPRLINHNAVHDYVRYQTVHAPETIIKNVQMLMPGCTMTIQFNLKHVFHQYWDFPVERFLSDKPISEIKSDVSNLVFEAVEKRMMADVPLGAFLSGGIDSSIITAVMSKLSAQKINTFSVNFDESEFSEGKYARMIAEKFGTNHTEILLTPKDFLDNLPDALAYMDHPSGDGPNSYIVSKATKQAGVTVALSGLGGDEVFAGYEVFKQVHKLLTDNKITKIPRPVRKLGANLISMLKKDVRSQKIAEILASDNIDFSSVYPISRQLFTEKQVGKFFSSNTITPNKVAEISAQNTIDTTHILSAVSRVEMQTYMQNVLLRDTDQMSMASSLEVRVPFLDHKLVEYVFKIPDTLKYPHTPKQLLVESLGILPDEVVNRPKMGFLLPWTVWLKQDLFEFADKKIKTLAARPFFNEAEILSKWTAFLRGDPSVSWARIWIFIVLEDYIQKFNLEF